MSLSLALSSALSGLAVSARGTQLVSDNIANAQTDGYAVRSLNQSSRTLGPTGSGVTVTGLVRHVNHALLAEVRGASANYTREAELGAFWQRLESAFGVPGEEGSLSQNLSRLGSALQQASFSPDQRSMLQQAAQSAHAVAHSFNRLHDQLQQERDTADAMIAREIGVVNKSLESIAELNKKIQRQSLMGGSPEALIDARQRLVDEVSSRLPVREFQREDGRIMLMAQDGSILVDRDAIRFDFMRTAQPKPEDRIETGAVSAISLNGHDVPSGSAMFATGQIGALLQTRDVNAPAAQDRLDQVVADLVLRFADPAVDSTLAPGQFGMFSIDGRAPMPADLTGIAGQLRLNPLLDPGVGGDLWRLRAGVNAAGPGAVLDNTTLDRMIQAFEMPRALDGTVGPQRSASSHAGDLLSEVATTRIDVEQRLTYSAALSSSLSEAFAAEGVDTDSELSKLLVLEQAYSANARVVSTVDAMMRTILEM